MRLMNFKRCLAMSLGMVCILWTSFALAVPYDGASVSINSAQFTFDSFEDGDIFTTAVDGSVNGTFASTAGPNTVYASFFDSDGIKVGSTILATLEVSAVDFTTGFTSGTGGGFVIRDASNNVLLRGLFADGSKLITSATGAEFASSIIYDFSEDNVAGAAYYEPGLFSATLGDVGNLSLDQSFTTRGSATAKIQSSATPVPEPATLLLLGAALTGLGVGGICLKGRDKIVR